jgi:hypothetical protein
MSRGRPFEKGNRVGSSTRFCKGQSGNPSGCPKYKEISQALRAFLALSLGTPIAPRTHAEKVAYKWLHLAEKGNLGAIRELTNRVEGLPRTSVEFLGHDPLLDLIDAMRKASKQAGVVEDPPQELEAQGMEGAE